MIHCTFISHYDEGTQRLGNFTYPIFQMLVYSQVKYSMLNVIHLAVFDQIYCKTIMDNDV